MVATLLLDENADLLKACHPDGAETIAVGFGAEQVAQAASEAISLKQGNVWFNLDAGIDYDGLFFNARRSDSDLEAIRINVFTDALLSIPGIDGFENGQSIALSRRGDVLIPSIPCLLIDCENSISRSFIGVIANGS